MNQAPSTDFATRLSLVWATPIIETERNYFSGSFFPAIILEVHSIASGLFFKMWRSSACEKESFQLRAWSSGHMHTGNPVGCAPHLLTFRRGCWLSGAAIEASAHEKAGWLDWLREQGVASREIECWDLTF